MHGGRRKHPLDKNPLEDRYHWLQSDVQPSERPDERPEECPDYILNHILNILDAKFKESERPQINSFLLFTAPFVSGALASLIIGSILIFGMYWYSLMPLPQPGIAARPYGFVEALGPGALVGVTLGAIAGAVFGYKNRSIVINGFVGALGGVFPGIFISFCVTKFVFLLWLL